MPRAGFPFRFRVASREDRGERSRSCACSPVMGKAEDDVTSRVDQLTENKYWSQLKSYSISRGGSIRKMAVVSRDAAKRPLVGGQQKDAMSAPPSLLLTKSSMPSRHSTIERASRGRGTLDRPHCKGRPFPGNAPIGRRPSTRSHTALMAVMIGTPRSKHQIPHRRPQASSASQATTPSKALVASCTSK